METAHWLVALGVVAVLALLVGALCGVVLMANDKHEWVRDAEEYQELLMRKNGKLRARLETYRTDAAKEFDIQ